MTFHLESIEWDQEEVLRHVGHLADRYGFYLGGGTAVALHFGHRRSVDFDWFTGERMTDPLQWAQIMRDEDVPFVTGQVAPGTLHGTVLGVHVSFLEYRYPLLQPLGSSTSLLLAARPETLIKA